MFKSINVGKFIMQTQLKLEGHVKKKKKKMFKSININLYKFNF